MLFYIMLTIDEGIEADLIVKIVRLPPPTPSPGSTPVRNHTPYGLHFGSSLSASPRGAGGERGGEKGHGVKQGWIQALEQLCTYINFCRFYRKVSELVLRGSEFCRAGKL